MCLNNYNKENKKAKVEVRNHFKPNSTLEAFGPKLKSTKFKIKTILDKDGLELDAARHPKQHVYIDCELELAPYDMIRLVGKE